MGKSKKAIMLADTRPALVGHLLLQLKDKAPVLFDQAIIYYTTLSENDKKILNSIMPCQFVEYNPPLPKELFERDRFKRFSIMMFVRYEIFKYLEEFEVVTWIDTDVLIFKNPIDLIISAGKTGFSILCEDPLNNSAGNIDYMRTCFTDPVPEYNLDAYLYCTGIISVSNKLIIKDDYTKWCYQKTIAWANVLTLPDQGVINALIQEFDIPVAPLGKKGYGLFPYFGYNLKKAVCIHSWGDNKFWNDWYLFLTYPQWNTYYKKWLFLGGSNFLPGAIYPLVSVVMPLYKPNQKYLKESLQSIVYQRRDSWQRFSNYEVIIVAEPFSMTETKKTVDSFSDPRIKLIFNDSLLGIAASLNKGVHLALGKYIARIDSDDIADSFRLYKQALYLEDHDAITMCVSDYRYFGDMNEHRVIFEGEMARAWSIFTCPFDHPTIMFRKAFFLENNLLYDETRTHVEDWELWIRSFEKGMIVGCLHEELTSHRWHAGGSGQSLKNDIMMGELVYNNFKKLDIIIPEDMRLNFGPWKGKVSDEAYIQLESIFEKALVKNTELKLYDQQSLQKAFSLRLQEAKTGVLSELSSPVENNNYVNKPLVEKKSGFLKKRLKGFLKKFYQPFRIRFEIPLYRIEQKLEEQQQELKCSLKTIDNILNRYNDRIADLSVKIDQQAGRIEQETDTIEQRTGIEQKTDTIEQRTGRIEQKTDVIDRQAGGIEKKTDTIDQRTGRIEQKTDTLLEFWRLQYVMQKKILLIGTPGHANIGDAAIAAGEYEFIRSYFPGYALVELTAYQMDDPYIFLQSVVGIGDIIFLHGGGNLGTLYPVEEAIRRRVISDFPDNKIVVLPQTAYFDDTEDGKRELAISSEIYGRHRDLTILTRGLDTLDLVKKYFPRAKSYNAGDMSLMLKRDFGLKRSGILACIRDANDESGIDDKDRAYISETIQIFDPDYEKSNNVYQENIPPVMRSTVINNELKKFADHKVVITDRLHGMIFALLTNTPCVVISAYTQKIKEFVPFLESSNIVFFIDKNLDKLENSIKLAFSCTIVENINFQKKYFDRIYEFITAAEVV
jgi:pyruvyl transferase EpsI